MKTTLTVKGRDFTLTKDKRTGWWRIRRRVADFHIDKSLRISDLKEAKLAAKPMLEAMLSEDGRKKAGNHTLEEVAQAYLDMPKLCREYVGEQNVMQLRRVVRLALGKELADVVAKNVGDDIWERYAAVKQGGKLDLSTPRRENISIVSTVRMAKSIFSEGMELSYRKYGINLDFSFLRKPFTLPVLQPRKMAIPQERLDTLRDAWSGLKGAKNDLYVAIGLAWTCGLRASEIVASQKSWVYATDEQTRILLLDRPEDGFRTKGGNDGEAWLNGLCIDPEFTEYLKSLPDGYLLSEKGRTERFIKVTANKFIRQFIPREFDCKGLHKLRGLFADQVRSIYAAKILADRAGIEAAALALGHKNSNVTIKNYLTEKPL